MRTNAHREIKSTAVAFAHTPLNPLNIRAVDTCEFDVNAK